MITEKQKKSRNKWDRENMTVLHCKVRKEYAAEFKTLCAKAGTNPNAVMKKAIDDFIAQNSFLENESAD